MNESIPRRIDRLIAEGARKVALNESEFQIFIDEMEPIYKEQWGGFLMDEKTSLEGEINILYRGIPVCLEVI